MRKETITYDVYKYDELSEESKAKVKEWYLDDDSRTLFFKELIKDDIRSLFNKDLEVQYSLCYCQGDGLNIFGNVTASDIKSCLDEHKGGTQLEKFENRLTEKEWKRILHYAKVCDEIQIPYNRPYSYCIANRVDIADSWEDQLENLDYKNVDIETLKKFEKLVIDIFTTLCNDYEKSGYEYFYEISDEELSEICDDNNWEFFKDGSVFS